MPSPAARSRATLASERPATTLWSKSVVSGFNSSLRLLPDRRAERRNGTRNPVSRLEASRRTKVAAASTLAVPSALIDTGCPSATPLADSATSSRSGKTGKTLTASDDPASSGTSC